MFKKLEKTGYEGLVSVLIYCDKNLQTPFILHVDNAGATITWALKTAEQVFNKIHITELRQKFSVAEIANTANYSVAEEKSNAEIFKKYGIAPRGGKRKGAGRKFGSLQKTPKTNKTEYLGLALTKEEKEFLIKQLKIFRGETNI